MLDHADFVVINKFTRRGSEDALLHVRKQVARARRAFDTPAEKLPVFGTSAAHFNDSGVNALYANLIHALNQRFQLGWQSRFRWIIRPGTDFYFVYTHNWADDPLLNRFETLDRRAATKMLYTHRF